MKQTAAVGAPWRRATTREQKKQAKLQRISEAAWEMFRRDGFEATTTRAVAEAAGVAAGTVFLYARDKNDLLVLAFHGAVAARFCDALDTLPSGNGFVGNVMHVFEALVALHEQHRALAEPLVKEWLVAVEAREPMTALTKRLLDFLDSQVTLAQETGELDSALERRDVTAACLGLYHASLTLWLGGWLDDGDAPAAHLRRALTLLTRGLSGGQTAGARAQATWPNAHVPAHLRLESGPMELSREISQPPGRVTIFGDNDQFVD